MNLSEQILKVGIESCLFLVPMKPVRTFMGMIAFTSSEDNDVIVPARITEERYKISDDYKITLKSDYSLYGKVNFYLSDLEMMINDGRVQFYIKNK